MSADECCLASLELLLAAWEGPHDVAEVLNSFQQE
jgi:hypothetical protein